MARGTCWTASREGNLCLTRPWPGMMRTVYGDHERFVQTYFSTFKGLYFTGDGARRDADGYCWITGRVDDVINVAGHRMGTAEVESALVAHPKVAEAAVVGFPHEIKGQGIYAYVTLKTGVEPTEALRKELVAWVRQEIGPIASPDAIQWAPGLPKTRSGKIMRRILRKIAANETDGLGDTSTLADPGGGDGTGAEPGGVTPARLARASGAVYRTGHLEMTMSEFRTISAPERHPFDALFGMMKGSVIAPPGFDFTAPAFEGVMEAAQDQPAAPTSEHDAA